MQMVVQESGCRIFLKPGNGKTATVLKAFDILRRKGLVDRLLVLAPLRVITTSWPSELAKWQDFAHLTYTTIHGDREAAMNTGVDVYLMNVEGLIGREWGLVNANHNKRRPDGTRLPPVWTVNPKAEAWLKRWRTMLVVDESTKFKNPTSARSKALKKYLHHFAKRVILTGTPRPGKLEDLFFQCYITDMGHDLGQYISHFRSRYMIPHYTGFGWEDRPGAAQQVAEKIATTTIQIDSAEAVPVDTHKLWMPLPPGAKDIYDEMAYELLTMVEDQEVMAVNAGVQYGKLRQIAQGAIFYDNSGEWHTIHDTKLDMLENLLAELNGEPALCLYSYTHDVERINARLGYVVPRVGGGVSASLGAQYVKEFSRGEHPLLLGHPQSVAHGIDGLQENCRTVIWFGSDPSWEHTYQANLRIARHGTKADQVNIYYILMDCGIEKAVLAKAQSKEMSEKDFLKSLREHLKNECQ